MCRLVVFQSSFDTPVSEPFVQVKKKRPSQKLRRLLFFVKKLHLLLELASDEWMSAQKRLGRIRVEVFDKKIK